MTHHRAAALIALLAVAPALALAQSPDAAAERARLGNERIQAEAERKAQEDLARQNQAADAAAVPAARSQTTQPQATPSPAAPARPAAGVDRTAAGLEQLRELGKLKDGGYLTDAEFQRIKQRILDSYF